MDNIDNDISNIIVDEDEGIFNSSGVGLIAYMSGMIVTGFMCVILYLSSSDKPKIVKDNRYFAYPPAQNINVSSQKKENYKPNNYTQGK